MRSFLTAVGFMTSVPVHLSAWKEDDAGKSSFWYPLIGILIGLSCAGFYYLAEIIFPHLISAALVLIFWIVLTGGLHLDGLCDCLDGFIYAGTKERRLEIMKDPHHGTFAFLGLFSALLLKYVSILSLPVSLCWIVFPMAASMGRWGILLMIRLPTVRPDGMAANLKKFVPVWYLWGSLILILSVAVWHFPETIYLILSGLILIDLIAILCRRKIGGVTGDVLGMTIELTEIVVLLMSCLLKYKGML